MQPIFVKINDMGRDNKEKRVVILIGPTGVGKTGLSLLLARALGTEIISADSMQIYRGVDIGTAKPTLLERKIVRHHMIDIVDPSERYSTGRYLRDVRPIIENLHDKGKIPLIVGRSEERRVGKKCRSRGSPYQ